MEYPVAPSEAATPWRTATLVAGAIAAIELVLLVVAALILVEKSVGPRTHGPTARAQAAAEAPPAAARRARLRPPAHAVARLPRSRTRVLVLNGNGVQGAAAQLAALVRARGYRVQGAANAPRVGYPTTLVMYRPGYAGEARRLGRDLSLTHVVPVDGMTPRQLRGAQVVVILGDSR